MNWLDILLCVILAASVAAGVWKGFARTVVGIISTILAIILAIWFYGAAGSVLADYVSHRTVANVLGFLFVFIVVQLAGTVAGWLLAKILKWVGLGWLDRFMGAALGVVRGALVGTALILLLCAFSRNPPPSSVAQSYLAPYMIEVAGVLAHLAPKELQDGFRESHEKVRKVWENLGKTGVTKG